MDVQGLKVLVIDDSNTIRRTAETLLAKAGCAVSTASDGFDSLAKIVDINPDIIFVDIMMPRMDGFEVATRVRASGDLKEIPIVMITSRTGEKHRQRTMELGVDHYMGKPYQEEQLLETLNQLLTVES